MTKGIGSGESPEVRRAIERLQHTIDILSDRYRDLRRERRQMRERVEQLEREREAASISLSARLETAAHDRKRAIEFEERAHQAERSQAELHQRIADTERALAERDALIAEQADTLERQHRRLEEIRRHEEESWSQEERFREEIQSLHEQIARANAEAERYREQVRELEEIQRGQISFAGEAAEELNRQVADMRQTIVGLEAERAGAIEAQAQLNLRLDAAMRDAAIARSHATEVESEIESLRTQLLHAGAASQENAAEVARLTEETGRLRELLDAREAELQSLHESIRGVHGEAALRIGELESEMSGLQIERERALKSATTVEAERDSARSTVESLLVRLKQIEASDDERLKAQRTRIEELTRDLSEALDMAAKKETELMLALSEQERLQRQIAELTERHDVLSDELEKLRGGGTNGLASPSTALSEVDRRAIVDQLRDAITLIDKHLGEE